MHSIFPRRNPQMKARVIQSNIYRIEGIYYESSSEYDAVKEAYKMAKRIEWGGYLGNETWWYTAIFHSGKAKVIVRRIR
jgi:hypothetical protein